MPTLIEFTAMPGVSRRDSDDDDPDDDDADDDADDAP
jgi:hypothetical protein